MNALFSTILNMFANDAMKDAGGIQSLGQMQDTLSQFNKPAATASPHDFEPGLTPPTPNPYASMLSLATQPADLPAMPAPPQMNMPSMQYGNLGMPNSQMMPASNQIDGRRLAAQAFGRYY